MIKPISFSNSIHPLLEDFEQLDKKPAGDYAGFIYLWKCLPEEMFYVGSHKGLVTSRYDGTGSRFSQALRHYGITQFKRVVIEYVTDLSQLKTREQYWIDTFNAVRSNKFYNIKNSVR